MFLLNNGKFAHLWFVKNILDNEQKMKYRKKINEKQKSGDIFDAITTFDV